MMLKPLLLGLGFASLAASLALGADFSLATLMQALARIEHLEADYQEHKTLAILNTPLVLSGTLRYRAPHYIEKKSTDGERFIIDEDWLTLENPEQGRRQFSLVGNRELQSFAAALRGLLSGDLALLERYYKVTLSGSAEAWRLEMRPLDARSAEFIELITASGRADRIQQLEILEPNGDHSIMTISYR